MQHQVVCACDAQDANGKFALKKKEQTPMLGQLVLPSASDTFTDVSLALCPWHPQQMCFKLLGV